MLINILDPTRIRRHQCKVVREHSCPRSYLFWLLFLSRSQMGLCWCFPHFAQLGWLPTGGSMLQQIVRASMRSPRFPRKNMLLTFLFSFMVNDRQLRWIVAAITHVDFQTLLMEYLLLINFIHPELGKKCKKNWSVVKTKRHLSSPLTVSPIDYLRFGYLKKVGLNLVRRFHRVSLTSCAQAGSFEIPIKDS